MGILGIQQQVSRGALVDLLAAGGGPYFGRIGATRWQHSVAGRCARPIAIDFTARPQEDARGKLEEASTLFLDLEVPCRKCEACCRTKARCWRRRCYAELSTGTNEGRRTWFVTLTFRPTAHLWLRYQAIRDFNERGGDPKSKTFESLPGPDARRCVERQSYREVAKFLKRLRKESGSSFRYFCVAELHEGPGENAGQVHYHLLISEVSGELRERLFRRQWKSLGFAEATLVKATESVAAYATKVVRYVSKSPEARVRCSKGFGKDVERDSGEDPRRGGAPSSLTKPPTFPDMAPPFALAKRENRPSEDRETLFPKHSLSDPDRVELKRTDLSCPDIPRQTPARLSEAGGLCPPVAGL